MPYIKQQDRIKIEQGCSIQSCGELNFNFSIIIKEYLNNKGMSYQTINDIIGALEGAKLEFNRRIVIPYEDKKIIENGDVYNEKI
jgi:hypothetical protein